MKSRALIVTIMESYDPAAFEHLFRIEDRHFWFRARNAAIMAAVCRAVKNMPSGYSLLEVGCGTGNVIRELAKLPSVGPVVGTDLHFEGLRYAASRTHGHLVQGDIFSLPFKSCFDIVGLFDVLEHLSRDWEALRALHNTIKPGGALVLTVPAHPSLWSYFDEFSHHRRRYRQRELKAKLTRAGFRVEYISQYMMTVLPAVWVGRRLVTARAKVMKKSTRGAGAMELGQNELRIPPLVNEPLTWLLEQETHLVRRGLQLPFGASLIAIARKPL